MLSFTPVFINSTINSSLTNFFERTLKVTEKWASLTDSLYTTTPVFESTSSFSISMFWSSMFVVNTLTLVLGVVVFYTAAYGLKTFKTLTSSFDINFTVFTYFGDLEEEVGAADDALVFLSIIFGVTVWLLFFTVVGASWLSNPTWLAVLLGLTLLGSAVIPVSVFQCWGIAFTTYLRGAGRSSSILIEAVLDIVSVTSVLVRFIVQNVRFAFILITFFELYEFIYINLSSVLLVNVSDWSNFYVSEVVTSLLTTYGLYLYYLGHMVIMTALQLGIYFALSFWLFFFLYTAFTLESSEKYFFNKRIAN